MEITAICITSRKAQALRAELEKLQLWDKARKLQKIDSHTVAIPVKCDKADLLSVLSTWPDSRICDHILPPSKSSLIQTPFERLSADILDLLQRNNLSESLVEELPQKWEQHGDLLLIPCNAFSSPQWLHIGENLWTTVANALSCKRIARHSPIANNGFRHSQVTLLLGNNGRVIHIDNGIRYSYDVTKCMFSAGNITEKMRVSQFQCDGQVVVDLFAGIGYFTLPYLVHANALHVHACEWNPDAIAALQENIRLNNVQDRCTIHESDNRKLSLVDVADRVNLGLIPTSKESWPIAVRVLKPSGGFLHVHGNVTALTFSSSNETLKNNDGGNDLPISNLSSCQSPSSLLLSNSRDKNRNSQFSSPENVQMATNTKETGDDKFQHVNASNMIASPASTQWASKVAHRIKSLLMEIKGAQWTVCIRHIEKVKSYAPHIDHVVADLECRPSI